MIKSGENLVYTSVFESLLEEYKDINGISDDDITNNSSIINAILLYFSDMEIKPNISLYRDIEALDSLFNVYRRLCYKYNIRLSINVFLSWVDISKRVFYSLCNGDRYIYISEKGKYIYNIKEFKLLYPKERYYIFSDSSNNSLVADICKRWLETCEASTMDGVINGKGNPVGLIFTLKSVYGYSDTKNTQQAPERIGERTADSIASDYGYLLGGNQTGEEDDTGADSLQLPTP